MAPGGSRPERLDVARITKVHGLRGEVVVDLLSSEASRLDPGATLERDAGPPLLVVASRPHQGKWLVAFAGVGTREAAEALRGTVLRAEPIDDPDALWLDEVIGAAVRTVDGDTCGTVVEVHPNPAADLLVLDGGALVPTTFVLGWAGEGEARHLAIDPPPGLLDLAD